MQGNTRYFCWSCVGLTTPRRSHSAWAFNAIALIFQRLNENHSTDLVKKGMHVKDHTRKTRSMFSWIDHIAFSLKVELVFGAGNLPELSWIHTRIHIYIHTYIYIYICFKPQNPQNKIQKSHQNGHSLNRIFQAHIFMFPHHDQMEVFPTCSIMWSSSLCIASKFVKHASS